MIRARRRARGRAGPRPSRARRFGAGRRDRAAARWRRSTRACRPRCAPSSPSCRSRADGCSTPETRSAAVSSCGCARAPSGACSSSRGHSHGFTSAASGRAPRYGWRAPSDNSRSRSTSSTSWRAACTRAYSARRDSPAPSERSPRAAPFPVKLSVSAEGLPGEVEAALYFVCAEALANVAKHASASAVAIVIERAAGCLTALHLRRRHWWSRPRRRLRPARARRSRRGPRRDVRARQPRGEGHAPHR